MLKQRNCFRKSSPTQNLVFIVPRWEVIFDDLLIFCKSNENYVGTHTSKFLTVSPSESCIIRLFSTKFVVELCLDETPTISRELHPPPFVRWCGSFRRSLVLERTTSPPSFWFCPQRPPSIELVESCSKKKPSDAWTLKMPVSLSFIIITMKKSKHLYYAEFIS